VSATTRRHRPGEIDGVHYHFLTPEAFDALIAEDGFLEWADFSGRRYGTPAEPVRKALAEGRTIVLEIDVQGARQVRNRMPEAVLVFLAPPNVETLARRLAARGTEDPDAMGNRLERAREEIAEARWFDHVVVNDEVDAAADAITRILRS
jgi:guanylate kinase